MSKKTVVKPLRSYFTIKTNLLSTLKRKNRLKAVFSLSFFEVFIVLRFVFKALRPFYAPYLDIILRRDESPSLILPLSSSLQTPRSASERLASKS